MNFPLNAFIWLFHFILLLNQLNQVYNKFVYSILTLKSPTFLSRPGYNWIVNNLRRESQVLGQDDCEL